MITFQDAMHHLYDLNWANLTAEQSRVARRAVLAGYRDVTTAHRWSYLHKTGRIATVAPYSTGTIDYDHTGGTNERQVTLAGGTWPTWAKQGVIDIKGVLYDVEERKSNTVITLLETTNPGADVAAATAYKLYRDTYSLPSDFVASDGVQIGDGNYGWLEHVHAADWLSRRLRSNISSGRPVAYTFSGDPELLNRMAVRIYPLPDAAYNLDFSYHRSPRKLVIAEEKTGKASTTNGSATVTGGSGANVTKFNAAHVGAIIRINATTVDKTTEAISSGPFGFSRDVYYAHERRIDAVASATSLTADSTITETLTDVSFVISDPIDIDEPAMANLFFRSCERQLGIMQNADPEQLAMMQRDYMEELIRARGADSRSFARRKAGEMGDAYWQERWRKTGADVA